MKLRLTPYAGVAYLGDGASQTFQGVSLSFTYSNLNKLQINGSFGVQARQFEGLDTTGASNFMTPVFRFAGVYQATPNTGVNLSLSRDVQLSDLERGLTYTSSSVSVGIGQKFFQKFSFNLGLQYQLLEYQGNAPIGRTDQYVSISPSVSYSFLKGVSVSVFIRRQQRTSDIEQFSYEVNACGINLSYSF